MGQQVCAASDSCHYRVCRVRATASSSGECLDEASQADGLSGWWRGRIRSHMAPRLRTPFRLVPCAFVALCAFPPMGFAATSVDAVLLANHVLEGLHHLYVT